AEIRDDGRIWISGPVLFSGYRPGGPRGSGGDGSPPGAGGSGGSSPRASTGVRWFRTGDLGVLDAAGRLLGRGRADDRINPGGRKVVPGEVAAALQTCPGVRDAAVAGHG